MKVFKVLASSGFILASFMLAAAPAQAAWEQDSTGWYYTENGSYKQNCWFQDADKEWYYFDSNGYRISGWLEDNQKWYYFDSTGKLLYNQWINENGNCYYLNNDGSLLTNTTTPDGYRVNENGVWRDIVADVPMVSQEIAGITIQYPEYFINDNYISATKRMNSKVYIRSMKIVGDTLFIDFQDTYEDGKLYVTSFTFQIEYKKNGIAVNNNTNQFISSEFLNSKSVYKLQSNSDGYFQEQYQINNINGIDEIVLKQKTIK